MAERVRTAAVLGAGVMGSGIAAHLAGAGIRTHLLDIVPPKLGDAERKDPAARNRFALSGLQGALKAKPAAFYDPEAARLVIPGNLEDHLDRLAECDLVIEAVVERMDIKKALFAKIAAAAKPDAILASNTSGLSIADIGAELPESAQRRLLVLHFFNPVRYMRLLEIVPGPRTDPGVVARAARIGEALGKGIVYGKDTPNFVANRIGVYAMMLAIHTMKEQSYTVEEVDKIAGEPMGRPRSAAFRTADIVGIDTFVHVAKNCYDSLPQDEERGIFQIPPFVEKLVASGRLGQKSGGGFYKKVGKEIQVLDLDSLEYRPEQKVRFDSLGAAKKLEDVRERLKTLVNADDRAGKLAWTLLSRTLAYTARRVGEIADDIVNIDRAMRWGFNWELGPFESWDAIGVPESVARMKKEGIAVPAWVDEMLAAGRTRFYDGTPSEQRYFDVGGKKAAPVPHDRRHIRLAAVHDDKNRVVKENLSASLVDIGDGCLCFEVHTKMNTIDPDVIGLLVEGIDEAERSFEAVVIANDGQHFGAGANLMLVAMAAAGKQWDKIEKLARSFQDALQRLRFAAVPVVAAPFQYAFGGACEVCMAADAVQAHAETYIGLVEVGAGVIPAGGGCLRMMDRWIADVAAVPGAVPVQFVGQAFLNIATAKVATSAEEGMRLRYLRPSDGVSLNRDHLLYHAKQRALGLARAGYRPPRPRVYKAAGIDMAKTMGLQAWGMVEGGWATEYDAQIARRVAHILCGGNVAAGAELGEQDYLDLEAEAFLSLCGEEKTQARIQSLLTTGKPLRN